VCYFPEKRRPDVTSKDIKNMEINTERFLVFQYNDSGKNSIEKTVAREFLLTIFLNGQELVTIMCSPKDLKYLAVGFLVSEGLLQNLESINKIEVDEFAGVVRVETEETPDPDSRFFAKRLITSGCGGGATFYSTADIAAAKIKAKMKISADDVLTLAREFQHHSELYLSTHGVHSAALCDGKKILVFNEDIGRHNAIDKIFGKCFLEQIPTNNRAMISSGRVSSEIMHKVAKRNIPIVISISSPTSLGVKIAENFGITLIASVSNKKFDVYTNPWRVD
jgi:FdhD protein